MRPTAPLAIVLALLAGTASAQAQSGPSPAIQDRVTTDRLLRNKGITLQWLDWNRRGTARVTREGRHLRLRATQAQAGGPGRLMLDGRVTASGRDWFTFDGTIRISDTPDAGRTCEMTREWRFAITQNRPYYRLREFEWCDRLTDYIDIYF